jgi:hypothetical protein
MTVAEVRNLVLAATWKILSEHPNESPTKIAGEVVATLNEEEKAGLCELAVTRIIGAIEDTRADVANML